MLSGTWNLTYRDQIAGRLSSKLWWNVYLRSILYQQLDASCLLHRRVELGAFLCLNDYLTIRSNYEFSQFPGSHMLVSSCSRPDME